MTRVFGSASPAPNQNVDVWVPITSKIYNSDDPAGAPINPATISVDSVRTREPTGLVLGDGSPVAVETNATTGLAGSLSATAKNGTVLSIDLTTGTAPFPGRQTSKNVTWLVGLAKIVSFSQPPLLMNFCYSPEADLALLGLSYKNVCSCVFADFAPLGNGGGSVNLRRTATFYKQPFAQETAPSPAANAALVMPIVASPVWQAMDRVADFAPALATIVQPAPTMAAFLATFGSLDVGLNETKDAYNVRGTNVLTPALPALVAALCGSIDRGLPALGRLLGRSMVKDQPSLATALTAAWSDYQALKASGGGGIPRGKLPSVLPTAADQISDKILDWVDGQMHK